MLVLPISETFLYVEPIYIQSAQARMPQLKKVVVAMGNTLIYRDTYQEAIAALTGATVAGVAPAAEQISQAAPPATPQAGAQAAASPPPGTQRIETIRGHLRRYRDLSAQGKWAEAGRELESLERVVNQQ
jgi:uncharacterized membrane protein (UPF0182 family)